MTSQGCALPAEVQTHSDELAKETSRVFGPPMAAGCVAMVGLAALAAGQRKAD